MIFAAVRAIHFASLLTVFGASALYLQASGLAVEDRQLRRLLLFCTIAALTTAPLWLAFVAAEMSGGSPFDIAAIGTVVQHTTFGVVFTIRVALLAWLCVAVLVSSHLTRVLIAGAALIGISVTSHAAAAGTPDYVYARAVVDALHLVTAGFWVGGLAVLTRETLVSPRDMPRLIGLLRAFSRRGAPSVAVLLAAGAANSIFILGAPGMQWAPTYLTLLAAKIVLAGVMVALALTNRFGVLPALERGEREAGETIPLTVIAELSCAAAILVIVGFLGVISPMQM